MVDVRDNWRILVLTVLCLLATLALFGPLGASSGGADYLDGNTTGDTVTTVTTGENGTYEATLPRGEYQIRADAVGYQRFVTNTTVGNGTTTLDISLNASETGTVSGTVTRNGTAVSGIAVNLTTAQTGTVTGTTGPDGEYSIAVPPGQYTASVTETGSEPFETTVSVTAGASVSRDISLTAVETGTVSGTVAADNTSLTGIPVEVIDLGRNELVTTVTTGENGGYDAQLNAGTYRLRVDAIGYDLFETNVTVGNSTVTEAISLTPRPAGTVTGTVTDGETPQDAIEVEFVSLDTGDVVAATTTGADGTYEQRLPTGGYDVRIADVTFEQFTEPVNVSDGATQTLDAELTPIETGTVAGSVTDGNGNGVSDVDLEFIERNQFGQSVQQVPDPTNLQYGLDLSGGARIRGQFVGMTAEGVGLTQGNDTAVQEALAADLGLEPIDVRVRVGLDTVEVYNGSVTRSEFVDALQGQGFEVTSGDIRSGVTAPTRDAAVSTLTQRVDQTGLSGADVFTSSGVTGENFVVAEVPGISLNQLRDVITDPGRVQIVAGFPDNGTLNTTEVLTTRDLASIQSAEEADAQGPARVPVTLTDDAGQRFASVMREAGFTNEGVSNCRFDAEQHDRPRPGEYCLYTVVDGEYVFGAGMSPGLAQTIQSGDFENRPQFQMQTASFQEAQELEVNLRSGALPTEIEVVSASSVSPSLAQKFKPLALLTALIAWLAVSGVVYYWYRDIRVAVPMLLTAASEVFLLLGFAATVGLALDLSHIAGLIAVIGTGLDDLIIVADEILQRKEEVSTGRIFQNRFRKAFWVIGMAAATTIIAMSPLAVLSLGDLQGFAIVTIVGVLIGIGITRPAYGDILRQMMLDNVKRK
jgi:preprotein translocase subunit SecD